VLEYEIEIRKMSKAELAKRTGLTESHVNSILKCKGRSAITPDTAIKLEHALGMPVDYWLNLEAHYHETQARLAVEAQRDCRL
jgi:addiction module HigA family antidote